MSTDGSDSEDATFDDLVEEARVALFDGELEDAAALYEQAERLAATSDERGAALEGRGNVAIAAKRIDEAKRFLSAAIDLLGESASPSIWGNLAFTLDQLGDFEARERSFGNVLPHPRAGSEGPTRTSPG